VKSLLKFCLETEAFEYVNNLASKKGEEAHRKLSVLKPSLSRTMLLAIIMQANVRVKRLCT
jgi:hypothetical protein